jgi:asparagine synthase (glutamine-hydrolysing)
MCGIAGLVDKKIGKEEAVKLVKMMTRSLKHRGPDDEGVSVVGESTYFGSRRLAVLDLSPLGHMPLKSAQGESWITYNGEVYNYKEIKNDLINKGYKFRSSSDTEVILNSYLENGDKAFLDFEGMFSLAIWSNQSKELVLACDHFGVKPLYYYFKDGVFAFASEIKSLLKHPKIDKEKVIDKQAVSLYFSTGFGAIPAPWSIYKDIKKLPAGHYLKYKNNQIEVKKYWNLNRVERSGMSFEEAVKVAKELIEESVTKQMVADVPVGSFLSGGIDSSLIASLMTKQTNKTVKTFSIGFKDKSFDESSHASLMANFLKTDHSEKTFSEKELLQSIPEVLDQLDEPLADASILPTFLLAKETRKKVTVALSGDGGDELFGGYPTYLAHRFTGLLKLTPKFIRQGLSGLANKLPASTNNISLDFKLKRALGADLSHPALTQVDFMAPASKEVKTGLFVDKFYPVDDIYKKRYEEVKSTDKQIRLQYLDLGYYLGADGLVKTDRASNLNSLEVRVPFLSRKLAELCFSLPGSYHYSGNLSKRLLKAVAKDYLPQEIINRPKKGFGVPMARWLKDDLNSLMHELLSNKEIQNQGLFNHQYVDKLMKDHEAGKQNNRMVLWALMVFEYWMKRWN